MTPAELRALTAQGPAVVLASRDDMLRLLDEREALRITAARHRCAFLAAVCILIAWGLA